MDMGEAPVAVGVKDLAEDAGAVRLAARTAALTGRPLRIVHAFVWPLELPPGSTGEEREHAERTVEEAAAWAEAEHPDLDISAEVVDGDPTQILLRTASKSALLVLRAHDPARSGDQTDAVSFQVAARAAGPVLCVRGDDRTGPVVVGVDGSADAAVGLETAVEEARRRQTGLVVLHAQGAPCTERLGDLGSLPVEHREVDGPADQALIEASADAQLVVVGAQGLRQTLLGPVTQAVLRHAECPVLVSRTRHVPGPTKIRLPAGPRYSSPV
ncbi:universal stress protein [Phytohabitans rumicis]|uniref:Universal stress protein n=1 Tax=Phytohabitans rumicis TaxID=1076125 RepID=A0A6V8LI24_9ACTN|nr:universal stress protein [Phytohabitans rumicis]GFJ94299.1 universal stress protein [Phytohabitans rumicis]